MLLVIISFVVLNIWLAFLGIVEAHANSLNGICRTQFNKTCTIKDEFMTLKLNFFYFFDFTFPFGKFLMSEKLVEHRKLFIYVYLVILGSTLCTFFACKIQAKVKHIIFFMSLTSFLNLAAILATEGLLRLCEYILPEVDQPYEQLPPAKNKVDLNAGD